MGLKDKGMAFGMKAMGKLMEKPERAEREHHEERSPSHVRLKPWLQSRQ